MCYVLYVSYEGCGGYGCHLCVCVVLGLVFCVDVCGMVMYVVLMCGCDGGFVIVCLCRAVVWCGYGCLVYG